MSRARVHMDEKDERVGERSSVNHCLLCGMKPPASDANGELWCFRQEAGSRGPRQDWCTPDHPLVLLAEVHSS